MAELAAFVAELAEDCADLDAAVADAAALSSLTFALDADVDATVAEDAAFVAELAEDCADLSAAVAESAAFVAELAED